jgi:4-carboxymuconolactone decarboxylase
VPLLPSNHRLEQFVAAVPHPALGDTMPGTFERGRPAAHRTRARLLGIAAVAPGIVQYTTDLLFRDLWLRPDLAPLDRSLVTVSALAANGQVAQISYHLNRAMDNGLTQTQAAEMVTQLAFYAGWPHAFSALPVLKDVFEKRPH